MKRSPAFLLAGFTLLLLGCAVMLGWWAQFAPVLRVLPDFPPMVFNTAFCFELAGAALVLPHSNTSRHANVMASLGGALAFLAALAIAEHTLPLGLGLEWRALHDWLRDGNPMPGRMATATATGFLASGSGQ